MRLLNEEVATEEGGRGLESTKDAEAGYRKVDADADADADANDAAATSKEEETPLPSLWKLLYLAKPEANMIGIALVTMIASEASTLYNPKLIGNAYDYLVDPTLDDRMAKINRVMMIVLLVHFVGVVVANFFRSAILGAAGERIVARLRNQLYGRILAQEMAFFDEHKSGELISRLGSDTTLVQQAASMAFPEAVLGFVKLCTCIGLMFSLSVRLAGVTIGSTAIVFLASVPFGALIGRLAKSYQDVLGEAQTHSTEALGAMRTVQAFAAEEREWARYSRKIGIPEDHPHWWPSRHHQPPSTYTVGYYKAIATSGYYTFIFGFGVGSIYISLWYGFKLVETGHITLGELTAFQAYIFQIGAALAQTARFLASLLEARGASGRIFQLIERVPRIPTPSTSDDGTDSDDDEQSDEEGGGRGRGRGQRQQRSPHGGSGGKPYDQLTKDASKLSPSTVTSMTPPATAAEATAAAVAGTLLRGHVEFENVTFSYPSRPNAPVLNDFTLTIPANTTTALVGSSGAGKSTVVSLLQRFYDVQGGSIRIDGTDIRDMDLRAFRRQIGCVQQEPQLFGLTVRENVCYGLDQGDPCACEEEMIEACRKANAHDFIMGWADGYDTLVGERGVKLSGGQKQRIAIARSILINPRILLLDEATSSLDAESEHLVQEAMDNAAIGRTVLVVAHRLSTITGADQIVVVDNHRIRDFGTHDELMTRCDKYQDLIRRQSMVGRMIGIAAPSLGIAQSLSGDAMEA